MLTTRQRQWRKAWERAVEFHAGMLTLTSGARYNKHYDRYIKATVRMIRALPR